MTYYDRAGWGARPPRFPLTAWKRDVAAIALHYEGSGTVPLNLSDYRAMVRAVQQFHMDVSAEHYIDIAYNYAVAPNGDVFECRGMDHQSGANGTTTANETVLAVCLLLGPDVPAGAQPVTDAMKRSFLALEAEVQRAHPNAKTVHPHSDYFQTACPGGPAHAWLKAGLPAPAGTGPTQNAPTGEFDVQLSDVTGHLKTAHGEWYQQADGGIRTVSGNFHGSYPGLPASLRVGPDRRFYAELEARADGQPGYVLHSNDGAEYAFPLS